MVTAVDHPLRLAVGSHQAGSGRGCAMNVISWESGDTMITDMPACADRVLALIVQRVNDSICTHRDGDLLCPACSVKVLDLAHRIVGTGTHPLTEMERRRVWVRVAADQARQVLHLTSAPEALAAIEAAEGWCDGTVTAEQCRIAATATTAANAHANAANTANAAAANAAAAAVADVGEAAGRAANATVCAIYAAAYVIYAAAYVAHAAYAAERLRLAHRAVDVWCEWAGFTPAAPEPVIVTKAIEQMLQVAQ
jgi:hypothetical protein